jgi:hypothetical protein
LVAKVTAFTQQTSARRARDLQCKKGCDACCHAWLSIGPVEAAAVREALARLPAAARERVRERGLRELAREQAGGEQARCAMLEEDGSCAIYEARPLVCRTQGQALRYPAGLIPPQALSAHGAQGDLTWCPLNYRGDAPRSEDVLDAERVDQLLGVVNHLYARSAGLDALGRSGLSALAAG